MNKRPTPWKRYGIPAETWRRMGYTHSKVQALRRESKRPVVLTCIIAPQSPFTK